MKHRLATFIAGWIIVATIVLFIAVMLFPQGSGYNSYQTNTFTAVAVGTPSVFQNSLIKYHQLIWTVTGTVTSCTVALDTSPDNVTFTAGGAIAGQTCTSTGSSSITGIVSANYVRVNMTAFVGTGSVVVVYEGWAYNPLGGGLPTGWSTSGGQLLAANGTAAAPSLAAVNGTTSGWFWDNVNSVWGFSQAGNEKLAIYNADFSLSADQAITWTITGSNPNVATSIGVVPHQAGVNNLTLDEGNGSPGSITGYLRNAQSCVVTSDITLSTGATTICTWTLPTFTNGWAWQCQIPWSVTAGTTPTLSIGVNASATPTGTTNVSAEIKTTNANVATEATVPLSVSGAVNVLTSPTLTPAATIFMSSTSGTLLGGGGAGNTFTITMTGTGASFAGVARAGSTCWFYPK